MVSPSSQFGIVAEVHSTFSAPNNFFVINEADDQGGTATVAPVVVNVLQRNQYFQMVNPA